MSDGQKYDSGKPRMDLLDSEFLEGVANVMGFGAEKYAEYGECDCPTNIIENGIKGIEQNRTSINETMYQLIQNIVKKEGVKVLKERTESMMSNLIKYWQLYPAKSVEMKTIYTLIIATQQAKSEADYVENAILLWASLKDRNGWKKHDLTCNSKTQIRTGAHNWRNGIHTSRLIAAAGRHLAAINRGETNDSETGLQHAYHLGCCAMFLAWMLNHRPDMDDRWVDPRWAQEPSPPVDLSYLLATYPGWYHAK